MFEQSGTFKNEFIKLGIPAEDYDIQNNFGETDHVTDLFKTIEDAYDGNPSLFDRISEDDLILAFFPCIYFCENNQLYFTGKHYNLRTLSAHAKTEVILERLQKRDYMYGLCLKMFLVCEEKKIRLIMENPYDKQHYLVENFPYKAKIIDTNRTMRGDYFCKHTQYWFENCEPTMLFTPTKSAIKKRISESKGGGEAGICSEDRSMISPDYARNFICDFILGKAQKYTQLDLFENYGTTNFNDRGLLG